MRIKPRLVNISLFKNIQFSVAKRGNSLSQNAMRSLFTLIQVRTSQVRQVAQLLVTIQSTTQANFEVII